MADEILGYSFGSWSFFFNFFVYDSSISVSMYID